MNRHESNDPRRGPREAAERRPQNRITGKLALVILALVIVVVIVAIRR